MRDIMSSAEIREKFQQGSDSFEEIRKSLAEINKKLEPLPQMKKDIANTKEIVQAWNAIKTGSKFLRWLAGVLASVIALYVATKAGWTNFKTGG